MNHNILVLFIAQNRLFVSLLLDYHHCIRIVNIIFITIIMCILNNLME